MNNSFKTLEQLTVNAEQYHIHSLRPLGNAAETFTIFVENFTRKPPAP